ncbi:MAG: hypothetical protein ACHQ1G_03070 [Planctomycetota bacterium]
MDFLERRVEHLEAGSQSSYDEQILALRLERVGLLETYTADSTQVQSAEARILAVEAAQTRERRSRCEQLMNELEQKRAGLLRQYTPDSVTVRVIDRKIDFLRGELEKTGGQ